MCLQCERTLNQVESNASRVYDDESRNIGTGAIDDSCPKSNFKQIKNISFRAVRFAVLAVSFWRTAVQSG